MENNSYYLNFLFFLFLSFSFFTIIKYFFYEKCSVPLAIERSTYSFSNFSKKNHVYFIPDAYAFLYKSKINNFYNIYILYIKKIFEVIDFLIKNNIQTITIDLFNLEFLKLIGIEEVEGLFKNKKFWTFFKNFIYHQGISVNFVINESLFTIETKQLLTNLEKKLLKRNASNVIVNFLIGYDIFEYIKKIFNQLTMDMVQEGRNISDLSKDEIKKCFIEKLTPVDLVIGCRGTSVTDSLLLESSFAHVVFLNRTLGDITKEVIDNIIFTEMKKKLVS
jgi:undecaprenyl pyrophosphate synthase